MHRQAAGSRQQAGVSVSRRGLRRGLPHTQRAASTGRLPACAHLRRLGRACRRALAAPAASCSASASQGQMTSRWTPDGKRTPVCGARPAPPSWLQQSPQPAAMPAWKTNCSWNHGHPRGMRQEEGSVVWGCAAATAGVGDVAVAPRQQPAVSAPRHPLNRFVAEAAACCFRTGRITRLTRGAPRGGRAAGWRLSIFAQLHPPSCSPVVRC